MRVSVPVVVLVAVLLQPCAAEQRVNYDDLKGLRQFVRSAVLEHIRTTEHPQFGPVVSEVKRVVNGKATATDLRILKEHVGRLLTHEKKTLRNELTSENIAALVYFFEGDLSVCRLYTEKTRRIVTSVTQPLLREDGTIRATIVDQLGGQELGRYIREVMTDSIMNHIRRFYEGGNELANFMPGRMKFAQFVARAPQNSARDRLLLTYPFEPACAVWVVHTDHETVDRYYKSMPDNYWRPPANVFKWYYQQVIREAGLEKQFTHELKLRNMTHLIPEEIRPTEEE